MGERAEVEPRRLVRHERRPRGGKDRLLARLGVVSRQDLAQKQAWPVPQRLHDARLGRQVTSLTRGGARLEGGGAPDALGEVDEQDGGARGQVVGEGRAGPRAGRARTRARR